MRATTKDARAEGYLRTLKHRFPKAGLKDVVVVDSYTITAKFTERQLQKIAGQLANPVIEEYSIGKVPAPESFSVALEIGYLPGVTDNVGHTVKEMAEDATGKTFKEGEAVYTSRFLFLSGSVSADEAEVMAAELHNPLIQRVQIFSASQVKKGVPLVAPKVSLHEHVAVDEVNLNVPDDELIKLGKEGIPNADPIREPAASNGASDSRRGPLALSLRQLHAIREYFEKQKRKPTDVELECLAQTWSEHCKHTIFADPLDEIEEGIYRRYIKGATNAIRKRKGKNDFCVSVFTDNAGGIAFDENYVVTHKVETHNSPSALDPFGGAVTGIVGVNRDCLGFGLGAKPIANVYGFCVGDPKSESIYFRDAEKTKPVLPARRILEGVVAGVNAGGNQSGIPTPLGFVAVDPRYDAKPLVFAGTVGLIPRKKGSRTLTEKQAKSSDLIVMVGGRVGLDGIHGATFSSEALTTGSPATAVQIGDPITQKKFVDAIVREARDANLYNAITDNGAGGLSSSVGEMAKDSGGFVVDLEKVPLKYPGLAPWQIWISESQERMTLAVPKAKWAALKKIFDRHGVEATAIGQFTKAKKAVVKWKGEKVMDMDMAFLHDGRPVEEQRSEKFEPTFLEPEPEAREGDLAEKVLNVLSRPSVGGTAFITEQYDHTVLAMAVTPPLQGRGRVNADSGVIKPLPNSERGVVLSHGYAPWYSDIDAYKMAAAAIDTAVRNAVAAGASLEHLAILDNFCWSTSNSPRRLYELKEAARACFDLATYYGTPYISGKDSMFNDFRGFTEKGQPVHIAIPPTLLISTIGVMSDVRKAVTLDAKQPGDLVYVLGETDNELGASEYFTMLAEKAGEQAIGNTAPRVDAKKNLRTYQVLETAIQKRLVASAIGVGRGGLAAALAKMAIAGKLGISADLTKLPGAAREFDTKLFSESQGRLVVTIPAKNSRQFHALLRGVEYAKIGEVTKKESLELKNADKKIDVSVESLASTYQKPLKNW